MTAWMAVVLLGASADAADRVEEARIVTVGPHVTVDLTAREVSLTATVCLRRGVLEYLLCRKHSVEHESIFSTEALPSHLHAALLLIAREPFAYADGSDWADRSLRQPAAWLAVTVEVADDKRRLPLARLVENREREDRVLTGRWIFAGSVFHQHEGREHYAADHHGGIIGLTAKGAAVVQHAGQLGIPYRGDHLGAICREETIPAVGSAVRLIFSAEHPDPTTTGDPP